MTVNEKKNGELEKKFMVLYRTIKYRTISTKSVVAHSGCGHVL